MIEGPGPGSTKRGVNDGAWGDNDSWENEREMKRQPKVGERFVDFLPFVFSTSCASCELLID